MHTLKTCNGCLEYYQSFKARFDAWLTSGKRHRLPYPEMRHQLVAATEGNSGKDPYEGHSQEDDPLICWIEGERCAQDSAASEACTSQRPRIQGCCIGLYAYQDA